MNTQIKKFSPHLFAIIIGTSFVVALFSFPEYSSQFATLVLALTLGVLLLYTYDTNRIANASVAQTELQIRPIICLYIRNVDAVSDEEKRQKIRNKYAITHLIGNGIVPSPYYIALRNLGNGPAFNVSLESNNFVACKYQTRFFAPKKDEHAVQIIRKPSSKVRNLSELKDEIFNVKCQTISGRWYEYKYKIVDIEERTVEYIL